MGSILRLLFSIAIIYLLYRMLFPRKPDDSQSKTKPDNKNYKIDVKKDDVEDASYRDVKDEQ